MVCCCQGVAHGWGVVYTVHMPRRPRSIRERILDAVERDPTLSARVIGARVGCQWSYVARVLRSEGWALVTEWRRKASIGSELSGP